MKAGKHSPTTSGRTTRGPGLSLPRTVYVERFGTCWTAYTQASHFDVALLECETTGEREALANELLHSCCNLWDKFTADFFMKFRNEKEIASEAALLTLLAAAYLLQLGIQKIESRHAAVRRLMRQEGSTWSTELASCSSDFVLMRQRLIELSQIRLHDPQTEKGLAKSIGGGAARAFFHQ